MSHRRSHRADANAPELRAAWRKLGGECEFIDRDVDDFWGAFGFIVLTEIKDGNKPPSARKLTESEVKFKAKWEHIGLYRIVENIDDVVKLWHELKSMRDILSNALL